MGGMAMGGVALAESGHHRRLMGMGRYATNEQVKEMAADNREKKAWADQTFKAWYDKQASARSQYYDRQTNPQKYRVVKKTTPDGTEDKVTASESTAPKANVMAREKSIPAAEATPEPAPAKSIPEANPRPAAKITPEAEKPQEKPASIVSEAKPKHKKT